MELFAKLGIDWRLLIAQLVNFAILFTALTFLLYKPLLAVLEARRKKIAESLTNAERIGEELKRANAESERIVAEARSEAGRLGAEALKQAEAARAAAMDKTRQEVAGIIAAGKAQLASERDAMTAEVRGAAAELISLATERVIGEKLTAAKDKHLIDKVLETKS
jgi:F-type H+-transporting ATPase subunit b